MSSGGDAPRVTVRDVLARKQRGERLVMVSAYDALFARLSEEGGADLILVGDSLANVILGLDSTVPVTVEQMIHHGAAVRRGATRALVVVDMPFMSYQVRVAEAVRNAGRLLQEGGAAAVKLEGGRPVLDVVRRLVDVGIPVMGHLGLQPQSVRRVGRYVKQATRPDEADTLVADAIALRDAGAFAIVLESIPDHVARTASASVDVPTIGIGAGPDCDGQILVSSDMLGLFDRFVPSFVKQYAKLADTIESATRAYVEDVHAGRYPQTLSKIER
jgi:3-methyl-2-oxobutanoate hydroxymethyltransferase